MNFSTAGIKKDPPLSSYLWSFSKPSAGPPFNLIFKEPCSSASQAAIPQAQRRLGLGAGTDVGRCDMPWNEARITTLAF